MVLLEQYRRAHNEQRCHSSVGTRTPGEVGQHRATSSAGLSPEHGLMAALAIA